MHLAIFEEENKNMSEAEFSVEILVERDGKKWAVWDSRAEAWEQVGNKREATARAEEMATAVVGEGLTARVRVLGADRQAEKEWTYEPSAEPAEAETEVGPPPPPADVSVGTAVVDVEPRLSPAWAELLTVEAAPLVLERPDGRTLVLSQSAVRGVEEDDTGLVRLLVDGGEWVVVRGELWSVVAAWVGE